MNMLALRHYSVALLVLLACGTVDSSGPPGPDGVGEPQVTAQERSEPHLPQPWRLAERRAYDVEIDAGLSISGANDPDLALGLAGVWQLTAVGADQDGTLVHARLSAAKLDVGGRTVVSAEELARLEADVARPIALSVRPDGSVAHARVPEDMNVLVQTLLKSLAASTQFVRSEQVGSQWAWEAVEFDTTGRYRAEYRSGADGRGWQKRKVSYAEVLARGLVPGGVPRAEILDSATKFETDHRGDVSRITAREKLRLEAPSFPGATSETRLTLTLRDAEHTSENLDEMRRELLAMSPTSLHGEATRTAVRADKDRVYINGMTLAQMLGHLDGLDLDVVEQRRAAGAVFLGMAAILRQDEAARTEAKKAIRAQHRHTSTLVSALGDAGVPATQRVLVELIRGGLADEVELQALRVITKEGVPGPETVELLRAKSSKGPNAVQALYSLGTAVSQLLPADPERAREAGTTLHQRLRGSKSAADSVIALRALANAGLAEALPDIEPLLGRGEEALRVAAVFAMHRIEGDRVDGLLADIATTDSSARVRHEALSAMGHRGPEPEFLAAFDAASRGERSLRNRRTVVKLLGKQGWPVADAAPRLRWVMDHDPDEGTRKAAGQELASLTGVNRHGT